MARLALAAVTGSLLFCVRAGIRSHWVFSGETLSVFVGTLSAVAIHRVYGLTLEGASERRLRFNALLSPGSWLGALACGRLIAFAVD